MKEIMVDPVEPTKARTNVASFKAKEMSDQTRTKKDVRIRYIPVSNSSMSMAMMSPQTRIPAVKPTNLLRLISALLTHAATGFAGTSSSSAPFSSSSNSSSSLVGKA